MNVCLRSLAQFRDGIKNGMEKGARIEEPNVIVREY